MNVIPPIIHRSKRKAPGEKEFQALFQLFDVPALLVNSAKEEIFASNGAFSQLTAFSVTEVSRRALRTLINGLPTSLPATEETLHVVLDRRNLPPLPVKVQVRILDSAGDWLALLVRPAEDHAPSTTARLEEVIDALADNNLCLDGEPMRQSLSRLLEKIHTALGISCAAIYRVEGGDAMAWRAAQAGDGSLLPETLPYADILRLTQTYLWRPGRRVQTELHRSARIQNITYVISTPLNQNTILVLAERTQEPAAYLNLVIEAFGKQISGLFASQEQMMELRHAALENRRELSIWRSMGENAQEGTLLIGPDLTVNEMNPAAEWMLGYADWEVKGQSVESILIGPEQLSSALEIACQGIPTHNMGNVSLHRRNGQAFPAHIGIVPVQREGETLSIIIFFSDISENVEIRNRTQQLEQRAVLGEVTAVFAHEVRNPINNISTGLQLLSVKLPENDPNQENINRLINDCQRLNHLMESVLNFSRHMDHTSEPVDIEALLNRLLDRWHPRMAKVNVEKFFHVEPNTPAIAGNPRSLEQVFTNLISNAVEAMGTNENGGTLAVHVAPFKQMGGRSQIEITISDNGPGIPDEIRERIFEPFVTTKSQGTGLGLAITKRIITAHQGSISVNTFPGGTVFHVLLPVFQGEVE